MPNPLRRVAHPAAFKLTTAAFAAGHPLRQAAALGDQQAALHRITPG